ncbi:uncharacterized protein LOC134531451 isoform X4 [Bacillus rossius redtenbacheri]|uniref:uncharacterized protein LOC134531451 isoform X4 n=1 Tax=Bacillus rossius redtenbacheri TaxID=93214 RepID=UPI002FDC9AE9
MTARIGRSRGVPARYVFAAVAMLGTFFNIQTLCFPPVALPAMVRRNSTDTYANDTVDVCIFGQAGQNSSSQVHGGEFDWDEAMQGYVMSAMAIGLVPSMIVAGRLVEIWSPKLLVAVSTVMGVLFTMLFPVFAKWDVNALIVSQLAAGLLMRKASVLSPLTASRGSWSTPWTGSSPSTSFPPHNWCGCCCGTSASTTPPKNTRESPRKSWPTSQPAMSKNRPRHYLCFRGGKCCLRHPSGLTSLWLSLQAGFLTPTSTTCLLTWWMFCITAQPRVPANHSTAVFLDECHSIRIHLTVGEEQPLYGSSSLVPYFQWHFICKSWRKKSHCARSPAPLCCPLSHAGLRRLPGHRAAGGVQRGRYSGPAGRRDGLQRRLHGRQQAQPHGPGHQLRRHAVRCAGSLRHLRRRARAHRQRPRHEPPANFVSVEQGFLHFCRCKCVLLRRVPYHRLSGRAAVEPVHDKSRQRRQGKGQSSIDRRCN